MKERVYNFELNLNWKLLKVLSELDRFDASWTTIEKKESHSLKQLKSVATIRSVGASTRIEGSTMTDKEVEHLLKNIDVSKIEDRDSQEVVGYFNVLDIVTESYKSLEINESNIKNLHNQLLKISQKDEWHRGGYKQHNNVVEMTFPDGNKQTIFKTMEPGYATEDAMRSLIEWYRKEKAVHPLVRIGAFVYDFLSIHPFQDGNGRLSRLLTTLCLMQSGYKWIQYVSLEHEIENQKSSYYRNLRTCQAQRPNEEITDWINFFLESLLNVQNKLSKKLEFKNRAFKLSPKEKLIYTYLSDNPESKSGKISESLKIPNPTVKRLLSQLIEKELLDKHGKGAGTNYTIK